MAQKLHSLSLEAAIEILDEVLDRTMQEPRGQLKMDADTAWEQGFETCLITLKTLTGPPVNNDDDPVNVLRKIDPEYVKFLEARYGIE